MAQTIGKTQKLLADIRAPQSLPAFSLADWQWQPALALLGSDLLALAIAWSFARYLNQFYSPIPKQLVWWHWLGMPSLFWIFVGATLLLFAQSGLYVSSQAWKNYLRAGKLVSFVYLFSLVISYFYDPKLDPPRSLFFTAWASSVGLVIGFRLITTLIVNQLEQRRAAVPIFIIASNARMAKLEQALANRSRYRIVGSAYAHQANDPATLQAIVTSQAKEVLAEALPPTELASSLYWQLRRFGIVLRLLPSSREMLHRRGIPEVLAGLPTLRVESPWLAGWDYRLKRGLDFCGALVGAILLAPLFIAIAIAIRLSSPGPVFFRQERMGLQGKVFKVWKFRTMVANAEALQAQLEKYNRSHDKVMFKLPQDPRITPIGRILRRTSLDELPQLFNVLLGQMSLVGPRPLPLRDIQRFQPWHHARHQVLPGITGLWQISGRSEIEDFDDVVRLDLYYIDNWSLNLDLEILVETLRIVLFGKGAY